jgi:uncharacterized protein (TIGR04255 family)
VYRTTKRQAYVKKKERENKVAKSHSNPLRHPPLSEVAFEITFPTRVYAVENRIADFQQRVMEGYPDSGDEFVLHIPPAVAFGKSPKQDGPLTPVRSFVFKNTKGTRILRVSVMSFNLVVSDYLHFDNYKAALMTALEPAVEIFGISNIQRLGLRYVNKILIPTPDASTAYRKYVQSPINSAILTSHPLQSFLTEISLQLHPSTRLTIRSGLLPEQPDTEKRTYLLDIDCSCQESVSLHKVRITKLLDEYHEAIETEFQRAITTEYWAYMMTGKAM